VEEMEVQYLWARGGDGDVGGWDHNVDKRMGGGGLGDGYVYGRAGDDSVP
jgi:hypothetical protein